MKIMLEKGLHKLSDNVQYRVFIFLAFISIFLTACYPVTRAKGVVKNVQGQPVADAVVKIGGKSAASAETKSGADGTFDFGEVKINSHENPMEIELTVEKEGFNKFSKQLKFDAENVDEIVLQSNR